MIMIPSGLLTSILTFYFFRFEVLSRICQKYLWCDKKLLVVFGGDYLWSSTTGKQCKVILVITFSFDQFNKFEFISNGKTQLSLWKGNPFLFGDNWTMCKRLLCNFFHMYISTQLGVGCINLSEPKGIKMCKKIAKPCEGTRSIHLLLSLDPPRYMVWGCATGSR